MEKKQGSLSDKIYLFFCGLSMGGADIVPGVSGGTIALIMGIYDRLIFSISRLEFRLLFRIARSLLTVFRRESRQNLKKDLAEIPFAFFIPLLSGIVIAMLTVIHLIKYFLFDLQVPELVFAFFFGLIIASIPIPFKRIKNRTYLLYVVALIFALFSFWLSGLQSSGVVSSSYFYIFFCGMLAVSAMILPGISGSFILLLLGAYFPVIDSVHSLSSYAGGGGEFPRQSFFLLLFLFAGIVIGILLFIKVLKYLLLKHHDFTLAAISGLMIGGLRAVWPFRAWPEQFTESSLKVHIAEKLPALSGSLKIYAFILAGFFLIIALSYVSKRDDANEKEKV